MHTFFLRIRTDRISLFRFLLEGYDGLAVLSTVDVQQGLVQLIVPKGRHAELWQLLAAICGELAAPAADGVAEAERPLSRSRRGVPDSKTTQRGRLS